MFLLCRVYKSIQGGQFSLWFKESKSELSDDQTCLRGVWWCAEQRPSRAVLRSVPTVARTLSGEASKVPFHCPGLVTYSAVKWREKEDIPCRSAFWGLAATYVSTWCSSRPPLRSGIRITHLPLNYMSPHCILPINILENARTCEGVLHGGGCFISLAKCRILEDKGYGL